MRRGLARPDITPIEPIVRLLVEHWSPMQIWLFGSRARGTSQPDSDWDLFVVVPDGEDPERSLDGELTPWHLRRMTRINADIVFCAASDFASCSDVPNTLAYEVAHTGEAVYDH